MRINKLHFDRSVYSTVEKSLFDAGFKDLAGNPTVTIIDGDIVDHLLNEAEEDEVDLDVLAESTVLPAVSIMETGESYEPGGLGGTTENTIPYELFVYGRNPTESKEIANAICDGLRNKIKIYDYTLGSWTEPDFPKTGQFLAEFPVKRLRNIRVGVSSLTLLDRVRRDISFSIVFFEN